MAGSKPALQLYARGLLFAQRQTGDKERGLALVLRIRLAKIAQEFALLKVRTDHKIEGNANIENKRIQTHGWIQPKEKQAEQIQRMPH